VKIDFVIFLRVRANVVRKQTNYFNPDTDYGVDRGYNWFVQILKRQIRTRD